MPSAPSGGGVITPRRRRRRADAGCFYSDHRQYWFGESSGNSNARVTTLPSVVEDTLAEEAPVVYDPYILLCADAHSAQQLRQDGP